MVRVWVGGWGMAGKWSSEKESGINTDSCLKYAPSHLHMSGLQSLQKDCTKLNLGKTEEQQRRTCKVDTVDYMEKPCSSLGAKTEQNSRMHAASGRVCIFTHHICIFFFLLGSRNQ